MIIWKQFEVEEDPDAAPDKHHQRPDNEHREDAVKYIEARIA